MKKTPLLLTLSFSLLLASCSQQKTVKSEVSTTNAASSQATANECAIFDQGGLVVTRVDGVSPDDFVEIAKTFEPIGGTRDGGYILLDIGKEDFERLKVTAALRGWKVSIDDGETKRFNSQALTQQAISGYNCYRTVEETYKAAEGLTRAYPNLAAWKSIGPTWLKSKNRGGYDMNVLVLTNKNKGGDKPKMLITSAIHAREYTTAELATRFAEYLLSNYGKDADITWMLDSQEIHLVLQANPDGRKEAEQGKMQRKNVNTSNGACSSNQRYGVDLNRNFDFLWGTGGSSTNVCDDTYRGPSAASEVETQNLQRYIKSIFPDRRGSGINDAAPNDTAGVYIDIHSYSELVLWPWGHTENAAPNAFGLSSLGRKMAYYNGYTPQQSVGLYPTSGTTDDFVYSQLGVASYTFELGKKFFEDCSSFTRTILPDNQAALLYAFKTARAPYIMGSAPDVLNVVAKQGSDNRFTLTARADATRFGDSRSQRISPVASAEYYVDTPPWEGGKPVSMSASDGRFNSTTENLEASLSLPSGRRTIYVRAKNADGNFGPVSAIFVDAKGTGSNPTPAPTPTPTPDPIDPEPTPTPPSGNQSYSFDISRGQYKYFPADGFEYAGGTITGSMTGTNSADLDLYLEKLSGSVWLTVAKSTKYNSSTEALRYTATQGMYRWKVRAWSGSGTGEIVATLSNRY